MRLAHYRRFPASATAGQVLRDLAARPCRFILVIRNIGARMPFFYPFPVGAKLFAALTRWPAETALERALDLHESGARMRRARPSGLESTRGDEPMPIPTQAIVADDGGAVGLEREGLPARHALYPDIEPSQQAIAPTDMLEVTVRLASRPRALLAPRLDVELPPGVARVDVLATVSEARGFERPDGEPWSAIFGVAPGPEVAPETWTFKARAADAESYELTVSFFSGAAAIGHVTLSLPRAGGDDWMRAAVSMEPVALQPARKGMTMVIAPTATGFEVQLTDDGKPADDAVRWSNIQPQLLTQICARLENAGDAATLREQGKLLWLQLPPAVRAWLSRDEARGVPLTITSDEPILPLEATVLVGAGGSGEKPMLGIDRPVVRWIPDEPEPRERALSISCAACIRPDYAEALTGAIDEETRLHARVKTPVHVGTSAELGALLTRTDVALVHFAGHAQGAPSAGLVMEAGSLVSPLSFLATPLLGDARPFVFINGCRAGFAQPGQFTAYANFPKTLIAAQAAGVLVSVIQVKVDAAPVAAEIFYDALAAGLTVGEAVRRVRERALSPAQPGHAASFMSYLAYAPPDLTLSLSTG